MNFHLVHSQFSFILAFDSDEEQFVFVDGFVHRQHRLRLPQHHGLSLRVFDGEFQANPRRRRAEGIA